MKYTMTTPCDQCPFLAKYRKGYSARRIEEFASGEFPCHQTAEVNEDESGYIATDDSQHCAGALIYLEKRDRPHQMMRIMERLGIYDHTKLNMKAKVR